MGKGGKWGTLLFRTPLLKATHARKHRKRTGVFSKARSRFRGVSTHLPTHLPTYLTKFCLSSPLPSPLTTSFKMADEVYDGAIGIDLGE